VARRSTTTTTFHPIGVCDEPYWLCPPAPVGGHFPISRPQLRTAAAALKNNLSVVESFQLGAVSNTDDRCADELLREKSH
jgi:hypothetical protein